MRQINFEKVKAKRRYHVQCYHMAYLEGQPDRIIAKMPYGCAETTAISTAQAINNVRYRLENESQYSVEQHRDEVWYYDYEVTDLGPVA